VLCLITSAGTKLATLVKSQVHAPVSPVPASIDCSLLPKMSLLIALYKEKDIAATLIANLGKIIYPPTHLQVILVLEADDLQTAAAILETELPPWIEILRIPAGTIKTKPRALNYALPFCSGEIVGVYDAEDAP
ncbi:MAG: glycosyl transferase, partial [Paracoccaceae bacterium]